jgi:outer membrane protein TolC
VRANPRAAEASVRLTLDQDKAGTVSYLNVIVTQADALAAERTPIDLLGRRMSASVLVIEGLGGGWSDRALPSTHEVSAGGG